MGTTHIAGPHTPREHAETAILVLSQTDGLQSDDAALPLLFAQAQAHAQVAIALALAGDGRPRPLAPPEDAHPTRHKAFEMLLQAAEYVAAGDRDVLSTGDVALTTPAKALAAQALNFGEGRV